MTTTEETKRAEEARSLYERDYYGWIQRNVCAIREGRVREVDWANVAEELDDMGKSERRALTSHMSNILAHLLKAAYWPWLLEQNERAWRAEVSAYRHRAKRVLRDNPSLKSLGSAILSDAWEDAVAEVVKEAVKSAPGDQRFEELAGAGARAYPEKSPWAYEQVLDDGFWPRRA